MPISIDISNAFNSAFGIVLSDISIDDVEFTQTPSIPRKTSNLGARFYQTDSQGREHFLPITLDGMLLPFAVISIVQKRNIVSTPMPLRKVGKGKDERCAGSVHEIINVDDYQMTIKGLFLNDDNSFPEKEILQLNEISAKCVSVELRSVITDIFLNGSSNHMVTIKSVTWPAVEGIEHAKPFIIELESDGIFVLEEVE